MASLMLIAQSVRRCPIERKCGCERGVAGPAMLANRSRERVRSLRTVWEILHPERQSVRRFLRVYRQNLADHPPKNCATRFVADSRWRGCGRKPWLLVSCPWGKWRQQDDLCVLERLARRRLLSLCARTRPRRLCVGVASPQPSLPNGGRAGAKVQVARVQPSKDRGRTGSGATLGFELSRFRLTCLARRRPPSGFPNCMTRS